MKKESNPDPSGERPPPPPPPPKAVIASTRESQFMRDLLSIAGMPDVALIQRVTIRCKALDVIRVDVELLAKDGSLTTKNLRLVEEDQMTNESDLDPPEPPAPPPGRIQCSCGRTWNDNETPKSCLWCRLIGRDK